MFVGLKPRSTTSEGHLLNVWNVFHCRGLHHTLCCYTWHEVNKSSEPLIFSKSPSYLYLKSLAVVTERHQPQRWCILGQRQKRPSLTWRILWEVATRFGLSMIAKAWVTGREGTFDMRVIGMPSLEKGAAGHQSQYKK